MASTRDAATSSFRFNHTMLRIKDPKASLKFYTEILGMELIDQHDGGDFTLYFLAFDHSTTPSSAAEKAAGRASREGLLELTWNHGTEKEEGKGFGGSPYVSGNEEGSKGFGHIAITVDDVESACKRFTDLGVNFKKRPEDGKMRHIAFIYDPDGYWIEIVPSKR